MDIDELAQLCKQSPPKPRHASTFYQSLREALLYEREQFSSRIENCSKQWPTDEDFENTFSRHVEPDPETGEPDYENDAEIYNDAYYAWCEDNEDPFERQKAELTRELAAFGDDMRSKASDCGDGIESDPDSVADYDGYFEKVKVLLNTLARIPGNCWYAIHGYAFFITDILRHTLVKREVHDQVKREMETILDDLDVGSRVVGTPAPFFDLPSLARRLQGAHAMYDTPCRQLDRHQSAYDHCFHTDSETVLNLLRRRARDEVRNKVLLSAGTVLSVELVEPIVEAALEVEGLPVDSQKCDEGKRWRENEGCGPCVTVLSMIHKQK